MNKEFKVVYADTYIGEIISEVYMVDYSNDRFLIVDNDGWFKWVDVGSCKLYMGH